MDVSGHLRPSGRLLVAAAGSASASWSGCALGRVRGAASDPRTPLLLLDQGFGTSWALFGGPPGASGDLWGPLGVKIQGGTKNLPPPPVSFLPFRHLGPPSLAALARWEKRSAAPPQPMAGLAPLPPPPRSSTKATTRTTTPSTKIVNLMTSMMEFR